MTYHFLELLIYLVPGSGVDTQKFAPIPQQRQSTDTTFLFIGRLLRDKGLYEYVEAAKIIKRKSPEIQFWVLGDFWPNKFKSLYIDKYEVDSWEKQNIIVYKGKTTDVRDFIAKADCVVLPSYREGTANVLLEASSMSKPIITTNVAGCKEIVEHGSTGFVCESKNSIDLAQKITDFINLPDSDKILMGEKGRIKMIAEFEKKIVVNKYITAINEILN
jgi:glycosyltransferase involved in cell wall biosynthesis